MPETFLSFLLDKDRKYLLTYVLNFSVFFIGKNNKLMKKYLKNYLLF